MDMIHQLIASEADHSLVKKLPIYLTPELLIIDELGYLALGDKGSDLFFQIISQRHQRGSNVITTNCPSPTVERYSAPSPLPPPSQTGLSSDRWF